MSRPGRRHQHAQDLELARREIGRAAADRHLVAEDVEDDGPRVEAPALVGDRARGPAQDRAGSARGARPGRTAWSRSRPRRARAPRSSSAPRRARGQHDHRRRGVTADQPDEPSPSMSGRPRSTSTRSGRRSSHRPSAVRPSSPARPGSRAARGHARAPVGCRRRPRRSAPMRPARPRVMTPPPPPGPRPAGQGRPRARRARSGAPTPCTHRVREALDDRQADAAPRLGAGPRRETR